MSTQGSLRILDIYLPEKNLVKVLENNVQKFRFLRAIDFLDCRDDYFGLNNCSWKIANHRVMC